jgi:hypothetical protein
MPLISDNPGRIDGGYTRLFGHPRLGQLVSQVQSAVIRTGNKLEDILQQETPEEMQAQLSNIITDVQGLSKDPLPPVQVVFEPKVPKAPGQPGGKGDIAVLDHQARKVRVIELKDGDVFDTKKSDGELSSLRKVADWITEKTGYEATYYFCSFNQDSKLAIAKGAKGRFGVENTMTGRELCAILSINYDKLRSEREGEQQENFNYFLTELVKIPEVNQRLLELLSAGGLPKIEGEGYE